MSGERIDDETDRAVYGPVAHPRPPVNRPRVYQVLVECRAAVEPVSVEEVELLGVVVRRGWVILGRRHLRVKRQVLPHSRR